MEIIIPDFNKKYIVFSHGSRVEASSDDFKVDPNYRIVTLHIPGKQINNNLVKIILNQINNKIDNINVLFTIKCPIGRNSTKITLENNFIKDYVKYMFKKYKSKHIEITKLLDDAFISYDQGINIKDIDDESLDKILNEQNYDYIKEILNFEIRTYRSGDICPKLLLNFEFNKSLSLINPGIFNSDTFENFDFNKKSEEISIQSLDKSLTENVGQVKSLIDFNNDDYVFKNGSGQQDKLFLETIKPLIPTGLLVMLSCGSFKKPQTKLQRANSLQRQKTQYGKKYIINYN